MDYKSSFICELKECSKYLTIPVTLPCGSTLCGHHLTKLLDSNEQNFMCDICGEEHMIPKEGFKINRTISRLLDSNIHLCPKQIETKKSIELIEAIIINYQTSDLASSDTYLYEYFSKLRNQIDLHREKFIEAIHNRSEQLLKEINDLENKCKLNKCNLDEVNLNTFAINQIPQWKYLLSTPDLNQTQLQALYNDIIINAIDIRSKIEKYKKDLLMGKSWEFMPLDNKNFGRILIKEASNYSNISNYENINSENATHFLINDNNSTKSDSSDDEISKNNIFKISDSDTTFGFENNVLDLNDNDEIDDSDNDTDGSIYYVIDED
jgi:hypothetical protein